MTYQELCKLAENIKEGKEIKNHKQLTRIFFSLILFPHSSGYRAILILVKYFTRKKRLVNPTDSTYPESAPGLYLPDCYSMRFTTLSNHYLTDWWCDVNLSLFASWLELRFCFSYLTCEKPVDLNSHRLSPLYYKRTDLPICVQLIDIFFN